MVSELILLFSMLLGFMLIRVPIAFALGISALLHIAIFGEGIPLAIIAQRLIGGVDSFPLLAVPFFYLAGELMNSGGITARLVNFASAMVGSIRGGLTYVAIITNMIMARISGSTTADASATGSVLIPAMKREGYEIEFAAALLGAAACIGPIIPPSIPMVVYGVTANVSIGRLFLGGLVPGVLMGIYLMVCSYFISKHRNYPLSKRSSLEQFLNAFYSASPSLAIPIVVVGGIVGGFVTPTESAVIAVLASLFLAVCVHRELKIKQVPSILISVGVNCGLVVVILGGASAFGWVVAKLGMGDTMVNLFLSVSSNKWMILVMINILFLILGCFIDVLTALVIFAPIFLPLIQKVGIDPVHFGVVSVLNLVLGNLTPPMGMVLFIVCSIGQVSLEKVVREVLIFLFALIAVLFLITFLPTLVLWLPDLLIGKI